jgi:hypothetical protein
LLYASPEENIMKRVKLTFGPLVLGLLFVVVNGCTSPALEKTDSTEQRIDSPCEDPSEDSSVTDDDPNDDADESQDDGESLFCSDDDDGGDTGEPGAQRAQTSAPPIRGLALSATGRYNCATNCYNLRTRQYGRDVRYRSTNGSGRDAHAACKIKRGGSIRSRIWVARGFSCR